MGNESAKSGGKNDNEILAELCMFERWDDAKELLKTPTDLDRIYEGRTALHWAVFRCNFPTVRLLHRAGADLTMKNENGQTAAEQAAEGTNEQKQIGQFLSRQARPKNAPPVSPRSPRNPKLPSAPGSDTSPAYNAEAFYVAFKGALGLVAELARSPPTLSVSK